MKFSFFPFSILCTLSLTGCAISSGSKSDKHQMEMSLHKVRTEVDEIKHDLNTYEIEHHILEGKIIDQEQTIARLKEQVSQLNQDKLETFASEIQTLDKKLSQLTKKQDKILNDIRQLSAHANDTTTALSQYKEKIAQFEKSLTLQHDQIQEVVNLRNQIEKVESPSETYTVQPGDSLEKIARDRGTSVEAIKTLNSLSSDLIVAGQKIKLP
jgi:LysM repeat protein